MSKRNKNKYIVLPNHSPNIYKVGGNINIAGAATSAASMLGNIAGNTIVPDTPEIDSSIIERANTVPSANSNASLMSEWGDFRNMKHVTLADVGGKSNSELATGALSSGLSGAAAGSSIVPGIGTIVGGAVGLIGGIFGGSRQRRKARLKRDELNELIDEANYSALANFENKIDSIDSKSHLNMMLNYFDFGGQLNTQGGNFGSGLTFIGEGGLHEENPYGGVMVGMDLNGNPNLLEEGEVKFGNYVFSDTLKADKLSLNMFNLKEGFAGKTFADIAESLSKESEERPNDPISKAGLEDFMVKLTLAQEDYKMRKQPKLSPNVFWGGGPTWNPKLPWELNVPKDIQPVTNKQYVLNIPDPYTRGVNNLNTLGVGVTNDETISTRPSSNNDWSTALRYAPIVGSALSVFLNLGYDYTHPDSIKSPSVAFNPIGNYLRYNPLDRNFYLNKLAGQAGATRSAIINSSAGNRATAAAGLLAADYNALQQQGNLMRQAEEYNLNQRNQVEDFNRQTNVINSEGNLKADTFNAELAYRSSMAKAQMREMIDSQVSQARSQNLTNLFDNIGEVGREAFMRNMINSNPAWLYNMGVTGNVGYKNKSKNKRHGGKLTFTRF